MSVSPSGVQKTVSMKTRGGPPDTAVRFAVRHGVIPMGAPIIRRMGGPPDGSLLC